MGSNPVGRTIDKSFRIVRTLYKKRTCQKFFSKVLFYVIMNMSRKLAYNKKGKYLTFAC